MTWFRRALSLALLIILLGLMATSAGGRRYQVCSQELAAVGPNSVVNVCRPLQLTDPAFLLSLLLPLALIAPDIKKLEIGGLVSIERKIEETQRVQREIQGQLTALALTQSVSQEQNFYVGEARTTPHMKIEVSEETLHDKAEAFLEGGERQ